jgi:hypothetical protein
MFHDIRLQIYKETKNMTSEQEREYYKKGSEEFLKKNGLKKVPHGLGYIVVDE